MSLEEFGSLQTNFVGRDGFRWWIGQVAPGEIRDTWGNRVRVRIMGYHPFSEEELPNDKLPYANILLGTTSGSGGAGNYSSHTLRPGDVVFGFFLDGDNAQLPCINGVFGRTDEVTKLASAKYKSPFLPYSGKTDKMKPAHNRIADKATEVKNGADPKTASDPSETGEQGTASPKTPTNTKKGTDGVEADNRANGTCVKLADACKDNPLAELTDVLDNLVNKLSKITGALSNIQKEINKVLNLIQDIGGNFVQSAIGALFGGLENILADGLDALFNSVFASTMAATAGNVPLSTAAGIAAQAAQIPIIEKFQDTLQCVGNKIVDGLKEAARGLLESFVGNILDVTQCAVEAYAGSFLADIVKQISDGLAGPLQTLNKILGPAFTVIGFLQGTAGAFQSILSFLDCGQGAACAEIKKWCIGTGPEKAKDDDEKSTKKQGEREANGEPASGEKEEPSMFDKVMDKLGSFNLGSENVSSEGLLKGLTNNPNLNIRQSQGCYTGDPAALPCGKPQVEFIGGGGFGALAKAFVGNVINETEGLGDVVNQTVDAANQLGGIIGFQIENPGQGYVYPPIVKINDQCKRGYGCIARATLNSSGGIQSIHVVDPGEGYPLDPEQAVIAVTQVTVVNGGIGYDEDTVVTDDLGNNYNVVIEDGVIREVEPLSVNSIRTIPTLIVDGNGSGANLAPVISDIIIDGTGEILYVKDCVGSPFEVLRVQ